MSSSKWHFPRRRKSAFLLAAVLASGQVHAWEFDAGADLRVREELMENVPGMPGTIGADGMRHGAGVLMPAVRSKFTNHMRFRPRVWGELRADEHWRLYTRLTDEFRWCPEPYRNTYTFPDELIVDNLFLEGTGLFDGLMDVSVGRKDLYNLYGLDHVFVDGTPGDGSRTTYGDLIQLGFNVTDEERLDLFFLHNCDDNVLRWGTDRGAHRLMTGFGGDAVPEMDDWGGGAIWSGRAWQGLDYQLFVMQKFTQSFERDGVVHPWRRREMLGFKLVPHLNDELTLPMEAMGQVGRNGDGDWLTGWSTYLGLHWKSVREGWKPFASAGFHTMSGDPDASEQDGGNHAWDPMWARGVNDSELFLYGTHYGAAWWSNMMYLKLAAGVEFGAHHTMLAYTGPMFAQANDRMGGGDGYFKGFQSFVRYDFPILTADRNKGERFEIFGHVLFELFNPGDYFETDKPSYFFRWQVDFRF